MSKTQVFKFFIYILFAVIGLLSISFPAMTMNVFVFIIAICCIAYGAVMTIRWILSKDTGVQKGNVFFKLILPILFVAAGILLIVFLDGASKVFIPVIIGIFALFFAKTVSARHKILFGSMLFVSVIIYFWQPLFVLFSLLRSATSYWYRDAFVSIFAIIFIAAYYFAVDSIPERTKNITFAALTFASLLLLLNYVRQTGDLTRIYYTVAFVAITAALLFFIFR